MRAKSKHGVSTGGRIRPAFLAGMILLFAVSAVLPIRADAAVKAAVTAEIRPGGPFTLQTPALTPGLPPPQLNSLSDRRIVAGVILVVFAGLAGITVSMWRDLGKRAGP